jgi:hypothetical protein
MGAIYIDPAINRATINYDECVECSTCFRGMSQEHLNPVMVRTVRKLAKIFRFRFEPEPDVCPTAAFVMEELEWPRIVRRVFSDPLVEHKSTGIHGRGTEEVKTNDVAHRVSVGEAGYVIEFGRPGVGVRFRDIQKVTMALARLGVQFEAKNPVTHLMVNQATGELKPDLLNEKILSAIVEIKTPVERAPEILELIDQVSKQVDTVMAIGVSTQCDPDGEERVLSALLDEHGYTYARAKTNLGLGRVTNVQKKQEAVRDEHLASVR